MATSPYYVSDDNHRKIDADGKHLPTISQGLDSVRTYQWEIHFDSDVFSDATTAERLVLAAKQVSQVGMSIEPIEVHRVNDKVFYPGKATPEELTVTFDNFYSFNTEIAKGLWRWYQSIYNPMTGMFNTLPGNGGLDDRANTGDFKTTGRLYSLNAQGTPISETILIGLMPISWKTAEFNYSTNEFHTIEMGFKYDFMQVRDFVG
tara:strand:- start:267 stop:881 length:615 start_codon:yes stop_codon:yes gene_type:complete